MPWRRRAELVARRVANAAESRFAPVVVLAAAVTAWWIEAAVMPLAAGRDFGTYVGAYVELFQSHPIDLGYVLGRTPIAPLVVGALLDPVGGALAEPGMSVLYGGTVVAWFLAARSFSGGAALLTAFVLLLYPGYAILFHELASDAVLAAAFAGWSLLAVRVVRRPTTTGFALLGIGIGLLVLVRPGNQALLVLALVPLLLHLSWRTRLAGAAALLGSAVLVLGLWTVHNGVRFGDYTVARGGNSRLPFERVFLTEKIVRPDNGPASRRLAAAVERDLLPTEPYRSYGIGLRDFFADPSPRMKDDLGFLANRLDGWQSDEKLLREAGIEAIRRHPWPYVSGVATTVWNQLHRATFRVPGESETPRSRVAATTSGERRAETQTPVNDQASRGGTIVVDGRRLPKPTEGERIPGPHFGGPTTPDGSIYTVWTSATERHLVFVRPGDRRRYEALHHRMDELGSRLPDRAGSGTLTLRVNQLSRWFPPPVLWLAVALVAFVVRRPAHAVALVTPSLAAFVVILLSALAIAGVPAYAVAVAPAFLLLAAGALLGERSSPQSPSGS